MDGKTEETGREGEGEDGKIVLYWVYSVCTTGWSGRESGSPISLNARYKLSGIPKT